MISLHNWLNNLIQSFTLYGGAPSGGGGAMGGGRPYNPMQQNQPFNQRFGVNPNMSQGQPNQSQNPMFRGMGFPAQPQGMPPMQGLPMQGKQFGNMNPYVSPMAQQPQGLPMQIQPSTYNPRLEAMKQMYQGQQQAPIQDSSTANYDVTGGRFLNQNMPQPAMFQAQPSQSQTSTQMIASQPNGAQQLASIFGR